MKRISLIEECNSFYILPTIRINYEIPHYVYLDLTWIKWSLSITVKEDK